MLDQTIRQSILQNLSDLNIFDIFAILYAYSDGKFAQTYNYFRKGDTFKQVSQRSVQLESTMLPPTANVLKPLDRAERQAWVSMLYANSSQRGFTLDCYALLQAIDRVFANVRTRSVNISNFPLLPQQLNLDVSLGHVFPKPANPVLQLIKRRIASGMHATTQPRPSRLRAGMQSGVRLRDHVENFVCVKLPEGLNLDFNRLDSSTWLALPLDAGDYKVGLVPLIDDMEEFIFDCSKPASESTRPFRITGVKDPSEIATVTLSLLGRLNATGVNVVIFPGLSVPREVRLAIIDGLQHNQFPNVKIVVAGSFHSLIGGDCYNVSYVIGPDGTELWEQRKMHPYTLMWYESKGIKQLAELGEFDWREDIAIAPRTLVVRYTPLGRVIALICSDLLRTDPYQEVLRDLGVNCIIVPAMCGNLEPDFIYAAEQYANYAEATTLVSNNCAMIRQANKQKHDKHKICFALLPGHPQVWWVECPSPPGHCKGHDCVDCCVVHLEAWPGGFQGY